jgi:hypothetical protein
MRHLCGMHFSNVCLMLYLVTRNPYLAIRDLYISRKPFQTTVLYRRHRSGTLVPSRIIHSASANSTSPLITVYKRVLFENPYAPISSCLGAAIFVLNSTSGPEGLFPSLLVFGMIPKLSSPSIVPLLNQHQRFEMLKAAGDQYAAILAILRVLYGLNIMPTDPANHVYNSGDSVYV